MRRFSCRILVETRFVSVFLSKISDFITKKTSYGKFFIGNRSCKSINRRKT